MVHTLWTETTAGLRNWGLALLAPRLANTPWTEITAEQHWRIGFSTFENSKLMKLDDWIY